MTRARQCRERAELTQEEAASQLGTSVRQLQRYEAGANIPEDMLLRMAIVYRTPELLLTVADQSPIHEQLGEVQLNNVNSNHVASIVKYIEELNEAAQAAQNLLKLIFNHGQVPDNARDTLAGLMEQSVYDVKTALAMVEVSILEVIGVDTGIEAHRRHKEKCMARGYLRKEKQPALVAERQAEYKIC